ncbi:hypothetical protein [Sulfurimonas xiamenensis]|uniref:Uncharacterized protein n=1 Tax=Sulfurimonas xiamenensis TaxID=2590021 RepID=A0AAJ4A1Y2_9BACT|nr:hypothetical protein [Sulfurimonas xiamenensis]QFR42405.1 hypothetical protein FJR47_00095 [Sulfurimonas xiamenensis]
MRDEYSKIDYNEIENFLNEKTKTKNYELQNIKKEDLIGFIFDEFAKIFESSYIEKTAKRYKETTNTQQSIKQIIEESQKRANNTYYIIYQSIYKYQYYIENKDADATKKFLNEERKIKSKVKKFIEILEPSNKENTKQKQLLLLLEDMQKNPYNYAQAPDVIPIAKVEVIDIKNQIIQALSNRLICRVEDDEYKSLPMKEKIKRSHKHGFNAVDAIFQKLPF